MNRFLELYDEEVSIINGSPRFDASLEEILHLITQYGYAKVYPNKFEKTKTLISQKQWIRLEEAILNVPNSYPSSAGILMMIKHVTTLVRLQSIRMGFDINTQSFGRLEEIQHEWTEYKRKVKIMTKVYELLTDQYLNSQIICQTENIENSLYLKN